jgi:hypothetical protein
MTAPKFSVVIPTRERADTLRFALRTCLDQTFGDYEIVVSDNFSAPATRAVVDEAGSAKVRYFRTPEPLAMSRNWEFAVERARGEYVLVLGDDDGLLPTGLAELDALTPRCEPKAVRWDCAFYTWPTIALQGQGDYLRVPLGTDVRERDGADAIRAVAAFAEPYTELPMLYNAAVRRDVLAELRRRAGAVFPHPVPDVYSGFAIAHVGGRYLSCARPVSVAGLSHASNGIATLFNRGRAGSIDREFFDLNSNQGLRHEPTVPDLPAFPAVPIADTFTFAKRVLFPELPVTVDRKELTRRCVESVRVSEADWPHALAEVRRALSDAPELVAWFDAELGRAPYREPQPAVLRAPELGFHTGGAHLDAATFGVSDVAGAARLCAKVLAGETELNAHERAALELHRALSATRAAARTAEASLHTACAAERAERLRSDARADQLDAQVRELDARLRAERKWSLKAPLRAAKKLLAKFTRRGAGTPTASA